MQPSPLFTNVLVGIDSHGLASDALTCGVSLAEKLEAKLHLVHASQIGSPVIAGIDEEAMRRRYAEVFAADRDEALQNMTKALQGRHSGFDLESELTCEVGHPAQVLLAKSEELNSPLIVLGPHEKRSMLDFGNTTRAVLSHSKAPVWLQVGEVAPIESILVPTDFSSHSCDAFKYALQLAAHLGASIRALHCFALPTFAYAPGADSYSPGPTYVIDEERKAIQNELIKWQKNQTSATVPITSSLVDGDPAKCIVEEAKQHDLVVMGTHGRTGLSRFLLGSVAYSVLKNCATPALVPPPRNRNGMTVPTK